MPFAPEHAAPTPVNRQSCSLLFGAIAVYVLLATALSVCQKGYFNADFVGYSTVAHRMLANPASSVTGYWSPLFSWCMSVFLYVGGSDLMAGRLVLLIAGFCYVILVCRFASRFAPERKSIRLVFFSAMGFCAALQGALWATYLLDPDLLANALVFSYLVLLSDTNLPRKPLRSFSAGLFAGFAYLAKGYMLPFLLIHLPVSLLILSRRGCKDSKARTGAGWLRTLLLAGLGLSLVAGPWIAVLSAHYGHVTFSTAGSANHANVSPSNFGHDPLWKPPLEPDFILNPHYGPDWSPFQSLSSFRHQLFLVFHNTFNLLGHVLGWVIMLALAVFYYMRAGRTGSGTVCRLDMRGVCFIFTTGILYCSGYVMVNLEARYIVPTLAPLLCLSSLMFFSASLGNQTRLATTATTGKAQAVIAGILLAAPFSMPDMYRIRNVVFKHSQSTALAPFVQMATELQRAGLLPGRFAASDYFLGLGVAYAADAVSPYAGQPSAAEAGSRSRELQALGVITFLDFRRSGAASPPLDSHWKRVANIGISADVYILNQ
jgi:hypothetical protein